jgi:hypothetical protein
VIGYGREQFQGHNGRLRKNAPEIDSDAIVCMTFMYIVVGYAESNFKMRMDG